MRVLLPSKGLHGQYKVDLRIPTFKDLRDIRQYSTNEFIRKCKFVEMISDVDLGKVTEYDVDYLFTTAAFSLLYNTVQYKMVCPEHGEYTTTVSLGEQKIHTLKVKKEQLPFSKRIALKQYTFIIPTCQQLVDAYDWAEYQEDEESSFLDAKVACIMGKTFDEIEWVRNLPVSIYASALIFQELNYHGIETIATAKCPVCGKEKKFGFKITTSVLDFDVDKAMDRFASASDRISFTDFMSMSVIEFNAFVRAINKRINGQN